MRDLNSHERHYSAREIAEILRLLERKNALGLSFQQLADFEATIYSAPPTLPRPMSEKEKLNREREETEGRQFLGTALSPAATPRTVKAGVYPVGPRREERDAPFCSKCENPMELGRWGKFYCKVCYMERKAAKERV